MVRVKKDERDEKLDGIDAKRMFCMHLPTGGGPIRERETDRDSGERKRAL